MDSIKMKGIIEKKRIQFPLRFPNFETALSSEVSGSIKKGIWSLIISKIMIDAGMHIRINPVTINVFLTFSGFLKPNAYHVTPLTFILQVAISKVENDQKRPLAINPTFGKYISLTKNMTDIYITKSTKNSL